MSYWWQQRREQLRQIIFKSDTKAGKAFDLILLVCIMTSVLCVLIGSVETISIQYKQQLFFGEWFFTVLFTLEYILRLISAKKAVEYARSFYGIVDLVSIMPTYVSIFLPGSYTLFFIRSLRLLRIFRILKLTYFLKEAAGLMMALKASVRKITVFLSFVLVFVVILGSLMYLIEGENNGFTSIPQSIYWAIVTMTTVGYGDIAPQTALGKLIASVIMLLGYGIIAVPTGIVTVDLSKASFSAPASRKYCDLCGFSEYDQDAKYCKYCGSSLSRN